MGKNKWNFSSIDIIMTAFAKSYIVKKANIDVFFLSKYGSWVRFWIKSLLGKVVTHMNKNHGGHVKNEGS